jgi:cellulose synthase/poly-beta-1,6-N-acetylglucosamine synthase-like glycosyltransferase
MWVFIGLIIWYFFGYGLFLFVLSLILGKHNNNIYNSGNLPFVSIIIPAYNEEKIISQRIQNCLELKYPKNKLEIIIGSDGSTDRTVEITNHYKEYGVKVLDFALNRGRSQVHNDCVKSANGDIIVFTDADTYYDPNSIQNLVRNYFDPRVGCVGGVLKSNSFKSGGIGTGQGLYWKWEYFIRSLQSKLGVLTKVSGANMSIRKKLYEPLPDNVDIDQAIEPIVLLKGYKVVHEPESIAYDTFATSIMGELSSRRRFTIRALTALWHYRELLNIFKYPWIAFNLINYRLFRYILPFLLVGTFTSNLMMIGDNWIYNMLFALQCLFYIFALIGYFIEKQNFKVFLLTWPFAFTWMNMGLLLGVFSFIFGRRIRAYKPIN